MNKRIKICMYSIVHYHDDPRIFHREAVSLSKYFEVNLYICAPYKERQLNKNLKIIGLSSWSKRSDRIKNIFKIMNFIFKSDCNVHIFYNPEILPILPVVKLYKGGKIIYDIHENFKELIEEEKLWLPKCIRKTAARFYQFTEKIVFNFIDLIWYPVPDIGDHYIQYSKIKRVFIRNVPRLEQFRMDEENSSLKNRLIYIGLIDYYRGIPEIIKAFSQFVEIKTDYSLFLVGPIGNLDFKLYIEKLVEDLNISDKVKILNRIPHEEIPALIAQSKVGLILYPPTQNWKKSLPNKLFEYMAMGIPVIASNFKNYIDIIERNRCGVCIDPLNISSIKMAMLNLTEFEKERKLMGKRGKKIIEKKYNWEKEEKLVINSISDLF